MTSLCAPFPKPMRLLKPSFHLISGMMSELFSMRTLSLLASPRQVSLAKAGGLEHLHCCGIFLCCTLLCYSSAFKIMAYRWILRDAIYGTACILSLLVFLYQVELFLTPCTFSWTRCSPVGSTLWLRNLTSLLMNMQLVLLSMRPTPWSWCSTMVSADAFVHPFLSTGCHLRKRPPKGYPAVLPWSVEK